MPSFDIISKVDLQEIDNIVNSANRELVNRYDFKDLNDDGVNNILDILQLVNIILNN